MVTPFDKSEEIDEKTVRGLTDWLIEQGVHGIFPNGSTGEMPKLKIDERKRMIDLVVDQVNGRVPVIAGVGDTATKHTVELMKYAKDAGADAAVAMVPFFWRYRPEVILDHYRTISVSVDLPVVLYDNPDSNNILSPDMVARIVDEVPNVIAVKDSSFDMVKLSKEIHSVGDTIAVIQGIEQLLVPSLLIGASAGIPGIGNFCARFMVDMYNKFTNGQVQEAAQTQAKLLVLCNATERYGFEEFIKEALALLGHPVGAVRKPSLTHSPKERDEIKRILTEFGLTRGLFDPDVKAVS